MPNKEVIFTPAEVRETLSSGKEIELQTYSGWIAIRGIDVGDAGQKPYVEVFLGVNTDNRGEAHRGFLSNQGISPEARITVRNSGGRFRSDKVQRNLRQFY